MPITKAQQRNIFRIQIPARSSYSDLELFIFKYLFLSCDPVPQNTRIQETFKEKACFFERAKDYKGKFIDDKKRLGRRNETWLFMTGD